jgi:hypothetical protein
MSFSVTWRRLLAAVLTTLVATAFTACGDDEDSSDTGTGSETTAETQASGDDSTETTEEDSEGEGGETTSGGGEGGGDVKATVRLRRAQANSREYSTRVEGAKPGDTIIVRAEARRPPDAEGEPTSDFTIVIGPGAESGLVVKTSAGDDTRRATVSGAGDNDPEVSEVSYRCAVPPADTFCPVEVEKKGDQYEMVVPAAQTKVPVVLYVRLKD